jgi:hypothetical protein
MATCFVIGPIGDRLADHGTADRQIYEQALQVVTEVVIPACNAVETEQPERADWISEPGEIPDQVFERLRDADIVIADVSGANPNVMYELGLRHSLNKITIQIGERASLPFDIHAIRTIKFVRSEPGLIDARGRLERALRTALEGRFSPAAATRAWLDQPPEPENPSAGGEPREPPPSGPEEGPGPLDLLAGTEEAFPEFISVLERLTELMTEVSRLTTETTEKVATSDARGGGASGRLAIAASLAAQLRDPIARYEALTLDYEKQFVTIDAGVSVLITAIETGEVSPDNENVQGFIQSIGSLAASTLDNIGSMEVMANTYDETAKISRVLRPPMRQLAQATRYIAKTSTLVERWRDRIATVQEQTRHDTSESGA